MCLVLFGLVSACASTAPLHMTSAGGGTTPAASRRVVMGALPSYTSVVVTGTACRQRFGFGPRYDEHPPCRRGMSAPTFTLHIPDLAER